MSETTNDESGKLVSAENTDSEIRSANEISRVEINKQLEKIKQERENENFNRWVEGKVNNELEERSRVMCYYIDPFDNRHEERKVDEKQVIRERVIRERQNLEKRIDESLTPYEQKVARLIYGLDPDGYQERSSADVAKILGINERLVNKFWHRIIMKLYPRYNSSNKAQETTNSQDEKKYAKLTPFEKKYMLDYENDKSLLNTDVGRLYGIRKDVHTLYDKIIEKLRGHSEDCNENIGKWYQERVIVARLTAREQRIVCAETGNLYMLDVDWTLEKLYAFLQIKNCRGIYYTTRGPLELHRYGINSVRKIQAKVNRLLNGITGTELDDVKS